MTSFDTVRVAAIQATPVILDVERTIEKARPCCTRRPMRARGSRSSVADGQAEPRSARRRRAAHDAGRLQDLDGGAQATAEVIRRMGPGLCYFSFSDTFGP